MAVYTCDINGYINFYNKAAVELWGREPGIGKDLWCGSWKIFQLNGAILPLETCPMALALKTGQSIRGQEIVVQRPDGSRLNVLPHPDPLYDEEGNITGAINTLVDITDLKRTKEMNHLLKEYNDKLEEFSYAASHDMQEPLRKIHTFSNMLLAKCSNQLDVQGKNYLNKISASSERMSSIIQDLLNYSQETNPHAPITETDLDHIVKNIIADLEILIQNKGAIVSYSQLPVIRAIPSQVNRLFYNLIQNALKFSNPDLPPEITISGSNNSSDNRYFDITVTDNGIGFETRYAEKIFGLFNRLNERHLFKGNGIGLALCKKIVENHNGEITAKSEPGLGSCFTIKLPIEIVV